MIVVRVIVMGVIVMGMIVMGVAMSVMRMGMRGLAATRPAVLRHSNMAPKPAMTMKLHALDPRSREIGAGRGGIEDEPHDGHEPIATSACSRAAAALRPRPFARVRRLASR